MSTPPVSAPPLAGLCTHAQAAAPGLSVDTTVMRLRRYVYLKSQSLFLMAGRFNQLPEWEVKGAFSLHLWQEAEHSIWFRKRITEMRTPPHHLDKVPDPALGVFVAELAKAQDSLEFLTAIYAVLKPALVNAFTQHLAESNPITDHPTRRLLQFALEEERAQLAWGEAALAALKRTKAAVDAGPRLAEWRDHLNAFLAAAGGVHGEDERPAAPAPHADAVGITQVPRRDERFPHVWKSRGVVPSVNQPVHERIWWMMNVRLQEMHVSELIASVIAEWRDQPWEFYHDLARHLWDETRHCMLGEVAFASQGIDFTQIPSHTGFAEYPNTQLPPADRYAFLWGIEQGLMIKSGKQAEVALAQAGNDQLATAFQDYDWADEVLHAQIGRRWLEPHFGDRKAMDAVYERIRPAYDQMKDEDLKLPGRNWWPEFYAKHLKDKDPNHGQSPTSAPPVAGSGY